MQNTKLSEKLVKVNRAFSTSHILRRQSQDTAQIAKYYRKNRLAYSLFNSSDGFVHMGMSSTGTFSEEDFYEQGRIVNEAIHSVKAKQVLELATGKGATVKYLARLNPEVAFTGLDLPRGQLKAGSVSSNVSLVYGDYHDLSQFKSSSFDVVYMVEALCHAEDKSKVVAEAYRVLRKGGLFVVIDGYFSQELDHLSESEKLASQLVAKSMMVTDKDQSYEYFINLVRQAGFQVLDEKDYSRNILPSLYRLESTAKRLVEKPKMAKLFTAVVEEMITANAVAGYLMPACVESKLFEYRYTLVKKPS